MSHKWKAGQLVETLVKSKSRGSMYWLPARVVKGADGTYDLKIPANMADRFGIKSLNSKVKLEKIRELTEISLGENVKVDENKNGIIRWVGVDKVFGSTKEKWYGVELTQGRGFSDGCWKGKRFFECNRWHGMFVKRERLMAKGGANKPASARPQSSRLAGKKAPIKRAKLEDYDANGKPAPRAAPKPADEKKVKEATLSLDNVEDEEEKYMPSPLSPRLKNQEETEIRQTFKFFDKNKDQRIDANELKEVMKHLGSEIDDLGVKLLMDDFDNNKNGTIEWGEFLTMMKELGGVTQKDKKGDNLNIG